MSANGEAQPPGDAGPVTCIACRGTGHVSSGLGGTPHQVICPWCQGTGHRIAGIDAQEHPSEAGTPTSEGSTAPSQAGAEPPSEGAPS